MSGSVDWAIVLFWGSLFLLFYTYLGYYFVLWALTRISPVTKKCLGAQPPRVAIVIAAYNEEEVIKKKIQNCLALNYPRDLLTIWIASDGSTDSTVQIARSFLGENNPVRLLELPRMGKANAINTALEQVRDDIVVFSDANSYYDSQAIQELVKHFDDEKVGCVCGRLIYKNPGDVLSGRGEGFYWRYETQLKTLESKLGYVAGANGAIYAIRREFFEPLPPGTINDDFLISMRIVGKGHKCLYEANALAYEDVAPTVGSEFLRHVRDGAGHYKAVLHLTGLLNPFLGLRALIYWSHRIFRWSAPFLLILIFLLNISLLSRNLYRYIFFAQILFYGLAVAGLLGAKKKKTSFIVYVPFYFCNLNLALLVGFLKTVSGRQRVTWERTER